jgi:hypothetical protein
MALVRALSAPTASGDGAGEPFCAPLPPSPHFSGACPEDYKIAYIRFLSCHLFGPVNHGQTWKGWERSGEKGFSDTCKNQPKRLDFDNTINLSSLIVSLEGEEWSRGLESGTCMKLPCGIIRETYSGIHLEIIKVSLVAVKQAWI